MAELLTPRSGRVKAARKLGRRSVRADHRLFLAEGVKALTEALQVPGCTVEVFATPEASTAYAAVRDAVQRAGVPWHPVSDDAAAALSGTVTPQGLVAVCRFLDVPLDTVVRGGGRTLVVCADVRDPGNAGAVLRCADAVGATGVVLAGHSVDAYNPKTVRASAGSLFHLPVAVAEDAEAAVATVRAAGFTVLAADGAGEVDLFDAAESGLLDGRVAWLFGNEAWGLPDGLARLADRRVAIPILGRAESLNLSTAAAVCLYHTAGAGRRPSE
ncbi:MAG: TrmH family RNA methyltransferase [Marmoricola sp.]